MYRGRNKFLPIALVAIVAIVAIIAMVSLGRALLNRGDKTEIADDPSHRALISTDTDRGIRMSVRGPIVADEDFRSYEIEITPIGRRMTVYKGYQREVVESTRLSNSTEAYTELVNALSRANYTAKADLEDELTEDDMRGACATGRLYTFELLQAQSQIEELWTTSCRNVPGSFRGEGVRIRNLLWDQIPTSRELLRGLDL